MNFKNIDRRLLTILMIVFVQMLGSSLIFPILPLYAQNEFELSPQGIALLISSFFMAQFLAGPYLGRLSDRYGRLPVLIVSQIGTAISFAMLAWAQSFEMLFFARILDGITGGNIIVAQAYVTDITPREKRTESLGYIFAAFGLGFIFGPALGGGLAALFDIRTPFLIAAAAALAVVGLTWVTLDETLSPEQRLASRNTDKGSLNLKQIASNRLLAIVLVVAFFGQFAFGLLQSTFALYSEAVLFSGYTLKQTNLGIGLLLSFIGITQVFTQSLLLRPAIKRYGEAKLVLIGHLSRTLGFFILAVVTSPWPAISSMIFFALGFGLMMPSLQSIATTTAPDELRGEVLGIYQSTINLATIFGTALAGFIFSISPPMPYWFAGGLSLLVILPILALVRQVPHEAEKQKVKVKSGV